MYVRWQWRSVEWIRNEILVSVKYLKILYLSRASLSGLLVDGVIKNEG